MSIISIRIPQIGEGLQEARLVGVLKQPGEKVKRDEPIYQMETDKAVMDVESPYEGILVEWLAKPDEILAIGAEVATIEVEGEVSTSRNANVPPKTKAYAKEKGLTDDQLAKLAASGAKLLPADIDAFLGSKSTPEPVSENYTEAPQAPKQRLLASRLVRGSQYVVPGTMTIPVKWLAIDHLRERIKASGGEFQPSAFTMFAFAVAQTLKDFPMFRSTIVGDDKLRTYHHAQLGIAVGLPDDELVLAVVPDADTLGWRDFAKVTRERIMLARTGQDQANEAVTILLTNMQSFGLRDAVPVVVSPAVATLFLGEVHNVLDPESMDIKMIRVANMALTFDHRVLNGVGAAQFLNAIKVKVETISSVIESLG